MDEGSSWLSWIIIAALLGCAAYFAMAESAFASVSRIRIRAAQEHGDRRAEKAAWILDRFEQAITTILICTNLVHITAASLVTILVVRIWSDAYVALSTVITTIVVFFVGEMLPKSLAKRYSERIALGTAGSLCFFMRILAPLAKLLARLGSSVTELMKSEPEVTVTEDELYDIIENMTDEGELDAEKGELVHSAMMFADVTVESVITARVDLTVLDVNAQQDTILAAVKNGNHSRIPVYEGSVDNIIGILQIRKYMKAWLKSAGAVDLRALLDAPYFVHSSTKIDDLLEEMSRNKLNMAVVTDHYGGTLGVVTVEDILEELVGEIWDEDDEVIESARALPDGSWELAAELDLEEVFELLAYEDPEDTDWEHMHLGEWAYEQMDLMPREGDSFTYHALTVTVSAMEHNRIRKLTVRAAASEVQEGGESR